MWVPSSLVLNLSLKGLSCASYNKPARKEQQIVYFLWCRSHLLIILCNSSTKSTFFKPTSKWSYVTVVQSPRFPNLRQYEVMWQQYKVHVFQTYVSTKLCDNSWSPFFPNLRQYEVLPTSWNNWNLRPIPSAQITLPVLSSKWWEA